MWLWLMLLLLLDATCLMTPTVGSRDSDRSIRCTMEIGVWLIQSDHGVDFVSNDCTIIYNRAIVADDVRELNIQLNL